MSIRSIIINFRRPLIILLHALLAVIAFTGAFVVRLESFTDWAGYFGHWYKVLPIAVAVKLFLFWRYRLFEGLWKYVGTNEMVRVLKALAVSSALLVVIVFLGFGHDFGFPRSIYVIDFLLALFLMGGVRAVNLVYRENLRRLFSDATPQRTIILGAGHTGDMALRILKNEQDNPHDIIGFLDDAPDKQGLRMHDVLVHGPISKLPEIVREFQATDVVFAIPDFPKRRIASVVASCSQEKLEFYIMPTFRDATSGQVLFDELRNVEIDDLLGRDPILLDQENIRKTVEGKSVLITGAGGSIGAELARQVALGNPACLILFEFAENSLFYIQQELQASHPDLNIVSVIGDVKHRDTLDHTFSDYKPQVVYHAAAYKHVPLMEEHPAEAVRNNVLGTYYLARTAIKHQAERVVVVSTDKAVRPTNVMGATKRYGELLLQNLPSSQTTFIGVRFGNVLGSSGSVIPTFRKQIADGGPITVTHPDITRYFITSQEAVGLVLQASNIGKAGDIFVLDMGEPVKIVDLARSMIELTGLRPDEDIKIEFVGLRPGEKMYEELIAHGEEVTETQIPKLMLLTKSKSRPFSEESLNADLERLTQATESGSSEETRRVLWEVISKHEPDI